MNDAPRRGTLWGAVADVPDARPGWCETCRTRPTRPVTNVELLPGVPAVYCSDLCALFDVALTAHTDALVAAEGQRFAAPVVGTRTTLRLVADVYDDRRLFSDPGGVAVHRAYLRRQWALDVADGLVLPLDHAAAFDALLRALDAGP